MIQCLRAIPSQPRCALWPARSSNAGLGDLAAPAVVTATAAPAASPASTPASAIGQQMPPFAEKTELLRNNDAELRITNRGGGISEVVLSNHIAENDKRVTLNSPDHMPIGAIVDQPATPVLAEFALSRAEDGGVRCERATPEG